MIDLTFAFQLDSGEKASYGREGTGSIKMGRAIPELGSLVS